MSIYFSKQTPKENTNDTIQNHSPDRDTLLTLWEIESEEVYK